MTSRNLEAPAVGLMVAAALDVAVSILGIFWNLAAHVSVGRMLPEVARGCPPCWATGLFPMGFGVGLFGLALLIDAAIIYGAVKMKRHESYGWALAAAILALIPCFSSPCCCLGIPFGVWALVVLLSTEGRRAFGNHQTEFKG